MRAEENEDDLIHQLDDYACFEKNLDTLSNWIKNQQNLKKQLLEKSIECESLRCSLDNANEEMKILHSLCEDFLRGSDSVPSHEFFDTIISQNTTAAQFEDVTDEGDCSRISQDGLTATGPIDETETLMQHIERLLNYDSQDRERFELKLGEANEECRRLKTQFEVAKNELVKTKESLDAEKMIRSNVETERDSLACVLEKIQLKLLKYEQHFSSADKIVGTGSILARNSEPTMELDTSSRFESDNSTTKGGSSSSHMSVSASLETYPKTNASIRESSSQPVACGKHNYNTRGSKKKSILKNTELQMAPTPIVNSKTVIYKPPQRIKDLSLYCDICQRYYCNIVYLKQHQRDIHGEPYMCSKCNKAFANKVYLKAHEVTHNSQKPIQSSTCDKSFKHVSSRRFHNRMDNP